VTVTVLLFARYREAAGTEGLALEVPDDATLGDLWKEVGRRLPALAAESAPLMAIDRKYGAAGTRVRPGAEVAFFPPVSGG
jgi:molybdopterin converting factor subunit 1